MGSNDPVTPIRPTNEGDEWQVICPKCRFEYVHHDKWSSRGVATFRGYRRIRLCRVARRAGRQGHCASGKPVFAAIGNTAAFLV